MTSLTPLLWRHQPRYYDVTNPATMTSLTPLLWRHYVRMLRSVVFCPLIQELPLWHPLPSITLLTPLLYHLPFNDAPVNVSEPSPIIESACLVWYTWSALRCALSRSRSLRFSIVFLTSASVFWTRHGIRNRNYIYIYMCVCVYYIYIRVCVCVCVCVLYIYIYICVCVCVYYM